MSSAIRHVFIAAGLLLGSRASEAAVSVSFFPSNGGSAIITPQGNNTFAVAVNVVGTGTDVIVVVRGDTTDSISSLSISNTNPQFVFVRIGSGGVGSTVTGPIASLGSFSIGSSIGGVFVNTLRTSGNCGSITTNAIQNAVIGGNLTGNVTLVETTAFATERIELLEVVGNVTGDITSSAVAGYFEQINVGGSIGAAASPRTISAPLRIQNIRAAAIFANISATGTTAGTGLIRRIETTSGSFTGSLTAREITTGNLGTGTPGVAIVGGTLNAPVTIQTGFPTGATINVPANGLTSQIIINNANNAANTWAGIVSVGTNSLTAANYPIANSILGNGSVGRVPFNVHDASSSPVNNAPSVPATDITNNAFMRRSPSATHRDIVIEFDGPIHSSASVPVNVDYVIEACSMPGGVMTFNMNNRCAFSISGRRLTITPKLVANTAEFYFASGRYKVSPNGSNLTCSNVPGSPSVADFEYFFDLWPDCDGDGLRTALPGGGFEAFCGFTGFCDPIDFNNNTVFPEDQDVIDFFSVLAGGPCSSNNICNDIDFNNNGVFPEDEDVQAFFDVLAGGCVYCFR